MSSMQRITRLIAAVLVTTLVIHMGDWPFVDEVLDDLQAQGIFQSVEDHRVETVSSEGDAIKIPTGIGFQYSIAFASVAPPVIAAVVPALTGALERSSGFQAAATEFIVGAPFKPPSA